MTVLRMVGIVLLVVGTVLFVVGLNAADSIADQISNTLTGTFTDNTAWYIYGGLGMGLLGLLLTIFGGGKRLKA